MGPTLWQSATSMPTTRNEPKERAFRKAEIYDDYRKLLERKDIEAVTIGTPDHWHTAIALAALQAGKHVYCEKPLTLTVDEGKLLIAAVKRTGKTFQVGTQQRGDQFGLFGRAVSRRCAATSWARSRKSPSIFLYRPARGDHLPRSPFGPDLNWDFWQGQLSPHDYCSASGAIISFVGGTTIPAAC